MRNLLIIGALVAAGCGETSNPTEECTSDLIAVYADADGDGFGDDATREEVCETVPAGMTTQAGDCDDTNADTFPGIAEQCDDIDNDCDGIVDDGLLLSTFYADADGDTFGDRNDSIEACGLPPGYADNDRDCDDTNPDNNPNGLEVCDGEDNDCDQQIDDQDPDTDPLTKTDWYADQDGDGFGGGPFVTRCDPPMGATDDGSDCDDTNAAVNPNAQEVCSGVDDDCDTLIDDDDPDVDPATQTRWYWDGDGDGYGVFAPSVDACDMPIGYADNFDDCDDFDPLAGMVTDWVVDGDGDGVGDGPVVANACTMPYPGLAPVDAGVDCDDRDPAVYPGNLEVCDDGIDNDCSGADDPCPPSCQRIAWKFGNENWDCPIGTRMPDITEWLAVSYCITAADQNRFDFYHDVAISVGGCDCKWNANWCVQPSVETIREGRMCGDFDQLQICVAP